MAWTITAKSDNEAEILLYDIIGGYNDDWERQSAKKFIEGIKSLGAVQSITLRINSVGGDVFEAQAMYNYLRLHKARKTVRIDGLAASAASLVAMVGDSIIMPENSLMMIHNPATYVCGEAVDMREAAELLDKVRDTIAAVYMARTGLEYEKIKEMMDEETWMSAQEAISMGFCDQADDPIAIAACAQSLSDGEVAWTTTAGVTKISHQLASKMPEAFKAISLKIRPETSTASLPSNKKTKEESIVNIENIADLEKNFPNLVTAIRNDAKENAHKEGATAERERIKALDSLKGPGRDEIIDKAKYVDFKDARDIAMELLSIDNQQARLGDRALDAKAVGGVFTTTEVTADAEAKELETRIENVLKEINGKRGTAE